MNGCYLLNFDGTGYFSSSTLYSDACMKKVHRSGKITYYLQAVGAAIVHPDSKVVIPLCPEIIRKQDGEKKMDCERNAVKRILEEFRKDHEFLFQHVDQAVTNGEAVEVVMPDKDKDNLVHYFRIVYDAPLNKSNQDLRVTFVEYWQENTKTGKVLRFSWVTDWEVTTDNVFQFMRGARARWKIENEIFNTLKNQGYNFGHDYGLGKKNLSELFVFLMMLAILVGS